MWLSNFFLRKVDLLVEQFLNNFLFFWLCLKNKRGIIFWNMDDN